MITNKARLLSYLLILIASNYSCLAQSTDEILLNFNSRARESFNENDFTAELSSLDDLSRCVLRKSIDNYLNRLNNWKLSVIDSFYVRNYPMEGLLSSFSFVATKSGKFYFVYLPLYDHYWLSSKEYYYNDKTSHLELKESFWGPVRLINSSMVDDFFNKEVFVSNNNQRQFQKAIHLLPFIFPDLIEHRIQLSTFLESIKKTESAKDFALIKEKIDPIVSRRQYISDRDSDYLIFSTPTGFLFLDFYPESNSGQLRLNFYLILTKIRGSWLKSDNLDDFSECLK